MTAAVAKRLMDVDAFFVWADRREGRWELFDGVPVAMAPQTARHVKAKLAVVLALRKAIRRAKVDCDALTEGMAVRVSERSSYQPDALVHCGKELPDHVREVPNPVIVVEVVSPTSARRDLGVKVLGYFEVPAVAHYLIVDPDDRLVIHHRREEGDRIDTRIVRKGNIALDPPGLVVPIAELFDRK